MATEQTPSTEEANEMWLKDPEKASKMGFSWYFILEQEVQHIQFLRNNQVINGIWCHVFISVMFVEKQETSLYFALFHFTNV